MPGKKELDLLLIHAQSALLTSYSAMATLDVAHVLHGWELTPRLTMTPVNLSSGLLGQEASVPGDCPVDLKFSYYIVPTGSATTPNVHNALRASGMDYALSTKKHTYTPTSVNTNWIDLSAWKYSGDAASGESILTKAESIMCDWELVLECGKPAILNFTGIGALSLIPAAGTLPTITAVPSSTSGVAFCKATTITVNGNTMYLSKMTVQMKNTLMAIPDPTKTYGVAGTTITDRKTTFSATVLEDTNSTKAPVTNLFAGTAATVAVKFGSAADSYVSWQTGTSKGQMTKVDCTEDGGINMYSIEGIVLDNSHTLVVNDA